MEEFPKEIEFKDWDPPLKGWLLIPPSGGYGLRLMPVEDSIIGSTPHRLPREIQPA